MVSDEKSAINLIEDSFSVMSHCSFAAFKTLSSVCVEKWEDPALGHGRCQGWW